MEKIPRQLPKEQEPKLRITNFLEVSEGFDDNKAALEASRCLNCKNPRCVAGCPVGIKIPEFIFQLKQNNIAAAAQKIAENSSLPAVCGRVCPQEAQCEGACILGIKGESVAIGQLERYTSDKAAEMGVDLVKAAAPNGKKAAIVGSGPAGLACAYSLAVKGYRVKIFEALHKAGGVLVYGIPEFRLPKQKVVERELNNLMKLGVEIETNVIIGKTITIDHLLNREGYDAVFIGSGAGLPNFMGIEGENLNGVVSANEFLTRANLMKAYKDDAETPVFVGKRVSVVGGGNVAMDAARTARRLGAEVDIVYRRTENELPARREEVHHAKEEGVRFLFLTNPTRIIGDGHGRVSKIECIKMELGEPDAGGRRRPIEQKGSERLIDTDVVIMSLGTSPNPLIISTTDGLEAGKKGTLTADENGQTSKKRVFAGGDAVTGAATVILAMGAGRRAAEAIDKEIMG